MKNLDLVQKAFQILISCKDLEKDEYLQLLFNSPYISEQPTAKGVCNEKQIRANSVNKRKKISKQNNKRT
jgi:hypothetical protein